MTRLRIITGALFVDLGEGREIKDGDRAGQIGWSQPPRARYECLLCHTSEGPVQGAIAVRKFVTRIHADHRAHCPANTQGDQAA